MSPKALAQNLLENLAEPAFGSSVSENSTRRGNLVTGQENAGNKAISSSLLRVFLFSTQHNAHHRARPISGSVLFQKTANFPNRPDDVNDGSTSPE